MTKDTIYPTMVIRSQAETIELQEKEIEILKKKLDYDLQWAKRYDELFEENNRLNNIINELEKWLEENDKQLCLRKLKELKEGKE